MHHQDPDSYTKQEGAEFSAEIKEELTCHADLAKDLQVSKGQLDVMKKFDIQTEYICELTKAFRDVFKETKWLFPEKRDPSRPTARTKKP